MLNTFYHAEHHCCFEYPCYFSNQFRSIFHKKLLVPLLWSYNIFKTWKQERATWRNLHFGELIRIRKWNIRYLISYLTAATWWLKPYCKGFNEWTNPYCSTRTRVLFLKFSLKLKRTRRSLSVYYSKLSVVRMQNSTRLIFKPQKKKRSQNSCSLDKQGKRRPNIASGSRSNSHDFTRVR